MFILAAVKTETMDLPGGLLVKPLPQMVCLKFRVGDRELSVAFDHATCKEGERGLQTYEMTLVNVMEYPDDNIDGNDLGCPDDQKFAEILGRFLSGSVIGVVDTNQ